MTSIKKLLYLIRKNSNYIFILLINFLRKNITLRVFRKSGYSLFPELVTFLITKRCNFNCLGCSSSSPEYTRNNNIETDEMSTEEIKKVIDQVSVFKPFIYFSGGEPTLRSDLLELIQYTKEKKLVCAMTTNGSLLNKDYLEKLIYSKLDFLSISIDGSEIFHNKMRNFGGAFQKASKAIQDLVELKKIKKITYPNIRLASIIYPEKIKEAEFIINLANRLCVNEVGFGPLMYYPGRIIKEQKVFNEKFGITGLSPIGLEIKEDHKFNFISKEYLQLLDFIKVNSKIPVFFAYNGNQYNEYFDSKISPAENSTCLSPWIGLVIQPNGDLEVCKGFKFGNIREGSIMKNWNNKKIRKFRKLRSKKPFPSCFRCNEGQKLKFD